MKSIKLQELILRNFKGVKEFKFTPNGENANIFGDNATGKTSLYDGFLWVLFDKDSQNKTAFEIRFLNEFNEPEHNQLHEGHLSLAIDNVSHKFGRTMEEDWTSRGTAKLKGFKYKYFLNGKDVPKTAYAKAIKELIDEETFKLMTNPRHFNENIKWEKRREIIVQVCGDASMDDILAADSDLLALEKFDTPADVSDLKRRLKKEQDAVNEKKVAIPIQIKEAIRNAPECPTDSVESLKTKKTALAAQVAAKQKEIAAIGRPEGQIENLKKALELEGKIQLAQTKFEAEKREQCRKVRKEIDACETTLTALTRKKESYLADIEKAGLNQKSLENHIDGLRLQWIEKNSEALPAFQDDDTCPTCRQHLPCEMIEASRQKATADFNLKKSNALERIVLAAKEFKDALAGLLADKAKAETDLADVGKDITQLSATIADFAKKLVVFESDEFKKDESALEEIARLRQESPDDTEAARDKKTAEAVLGHIQDELQAVNAGILAHESAEKITARIEELKAQEKTLAAEYEALEEQLSLCEKFTRIRVRMLEDKIASKFKSARFKMFHEQINEGLKDCCETLYNGVPYGNMNDAARTNIGLDIIATLIEHYGVSAPIFIDDAILVTALYPVPAQTIRLIVSEGDKVLKCGDENSKPTPVVPNPFPMDDDEKPIEEVKRAMRLEILNNL